MTKTPAQIFEAAKALAGFAAISADKALPTEVERGLDCGFAWVIVNPARGPFVAWCKANNIGHKHYKAGWEFWYSAFDPTNTQSISVHEAAAKAFAESLQSEGINASWGSRLD